MIQYGIFKQNITCKHAKVQRSIEYTINVIPDSNEGKIKENSKA